MQTINRITLEDYPLETLDTSRDKILLTAGDTVFDISNKAMSIEPFTNFAKRKAVNSKLNTTDPQYGLCLKTYQKIDMRLNIRPLTISFHFNLFFKPNLIWMIG